MGLQNDIHFIPQGLQFFPPTAAPGFHERVWIAECHPAVDRNTADELQIRDARTGDWIAYELMLGIDAAFVVKTLEKARQWHEFPTIIQTRGEAFHTPAFVRWADHAGILLEPDLGVHPLANTPTPFPQLHRGRAAPPVDAEPVQKSNPTGLLAGPPLPDLGRKVADRCPPDGFFMWNFKLSQITIRSWDQCLALCVHPWGGEPHAVRLEFPRLILLRLLEAFPDAHKRALVRRVAGLSLPVEIELPSPVTVTAMQCAIRSEDAEPRHETVAFQILQVRVKQVGDHTLSSRKLH